jgi:hypothetical protein
MSAVRLWFFKNKEWEKTRPKYAPLEWAEKETLESTRIMKWYITVGTKSNDKDTETNWDEHYQLDLENLSVTSA